MAQLFSLGHYATSSSKNVVGALLLADCEAVASGSCFVLRLGLVYRSWMSLFVLASWAERATGYGFEAARCAYVGWLRMDSCCLHFEIEARHMAEALPQQDFIF